MCSGWVSGSWIEVIEGREREKGREWIGEEGGRGRRMGIAHTLFSA